MDHANSNSVVLVASLIAASFLTKSTEGVLESSTSCPLAPDCCEHDCCGPGTSWGTAEGACVSDLESSGFDGTYPPEREFGCIPRKCCEGGDSLVQQTTCCGTGTHYNQVTKFCYPSQVLLHKLDAARDRWRYGCPTIKHYELNTVRGCGICGPLVRTEMKALVADGVIEMGVYTTGDLQGIPVGPADFPPTIEEQFDLIHHAITVRNAYRIDVEYDEECGYPLSIAIDYNKFAYDEEYIRINKNLAPVANPIQCNQNMCFQDQFCCNESCSICAPIGGGCIELFCENGTLPKEVTSSESCESLGGSGSGCESTLTRRDGSVTVEVTQVNGFEEDHAFTIWFDSCKLSTSCDEKNGDRQLYHLGGFIKNAGLSLPLVFNVPDFVVSGGGIIPAGCPEGLPAGECVTYDQRSYRRPCSLIFPRNCEEGVVCDNDDLGFGTGLFNAKTDSINLWFKDHGLYDETATYDDDNDPLRTFNGGCTSDTVHFPKTRCPMDDENGNSCKDIAFVSFGVTQTVYEYY